MDLDVSFDCMDEYWYLYIHPTMPADNTLAFYLMNNRTNDSFS
jgi:hypothetical protein